ncbi:3-oxo-tetronate kinase [Martelella alba]|uniref:3-oxo-tetronate kinase n=1 Tax=Martelella alba TaxID=2590451 RepID=A0ABY2SIA0_9HYPH|nr:3-oxo-tetronate kinase [Martelella alba]TKI04094.1 four-carbon acid sugar kinase family protein [Martelella alba]
MLIGVIADDFTGASDIGIALAKGLEGEGGIKTALFMGTPAHDVNADIVAGVVALKSRSLPADQAVAHALSACEWLLRQGCRQILFKYCSTFDSTAEGNIGPVAEALAQRLDARGVVVCPAFPDMGRTLYQGHLFVGEKLLNESGMEHHPLTPMTDPDIRRVLASQSRHPQGFIPWRQTQLGDGALRQALEVHGRQGHWLVVVDALTNRDLVTLGAACADARLITGGSAIAQGLPHNFIARGLASGAAPARIGARGKGAILVGSCSRMTLRQIHYHAQNHAVLEVKAEEIMAGRAEPGALLAFVDENQHRSPLICTSGDVERVNALQERYGRDNVADAIERFFADLAVRLFDAGIRRLVVGGGETSGAVVKGLAIDSVAIGAEISIGVPALRATCRKDTIGLALKSGNFGEEDFFSTALEALRA